MVLSSGNIAYIIVAWIDWDGITELRSLGKKAVPIGIAGAISVWGIMLRSN